MAKFRDRGFIGEITIFGYVVTTQAPAEGFIDE